MEKTTPRGVARHTFSIEDEKLIYRIELKLADEPDFRQFLVGAYQRIIRALSRALSLPDPAENESGVATDRERRIAPLRLEER